MGNDRWDIYSKVRHIDFSAGRQQISLTRSDWTPENRTLGQCSITAFLIQDIYGGKVYGIQRGDGNFHCFNNVDGCIFDLTSEQFGDEKLDYTDCSEQFRDVHFQKEEKRLRYELLKDKLSKELK